jgi:ferredoxin
MKITIDNNKCTGCGACRKACPKGPKIFLLKDRNGKKVAEVGDPSYCLGCRMCVSVCKPGAITLKN